MWNVKCGELWAGFCSQCSEIRESLTPSYSVYSTPSHLYRARRYERLGETDTAIKLYQLLVDLWKDADPELQPIVEESRAGLERLLVEQARDQNQES
jgi:hypothetical protein